MLFLEKISKFENYFLEKTRSYHKNCDTFSSRDHLIKGLLLMAEGKSEVITVFFWPVERT